MILYRLLLKLFEHGTSFVMTSNYEPSTLYPDGLHRDRILPAIKLIQDRMDILNVDAGVDYRRRSLEHVELYHHPLDEAAQSALQQAFDRLADTAPQILDARASARFEGQAPEPRPGLRSGHIPGALNLPINDILDANSGLLKSKEELRALFDKAGINWDKPVITSCGSGVTAAGLTLAFALLGKTDVQLFDGSWTKWGSYDAPLETGLAVTG